MFKMYDVLVHISLRALPGQYHALVQAFSLDDYLKFFLLKPGCLYEKQQRPQFP